MQPGSPAAYQYRAFGPSPCPLQEGRQIDQVISIFVSIFSFQRGFSMSKTATDFPTRKIEKTREAAGRV